MKPPASRVESPLGPTHSIALALGPGMATARGLAVDRDRLRPGIAQPLDPVGEAGPEQRRVEGRDDFAQRVVAWNAARERQEAT